MKMYFIVEKNPTLSIPIKQNEKVINLIVPAFMTQKFKNGEEVIPVFISRFHASLYIKSAVNSAELLRNFELIDENSHQLSFYQKICNEIKKTDRPPSFYDCKIVIGVAKSGRAFYPVCSRNTFSLVDIFCNNTQVELEIKKEIGNYNYQVIVENEKMTDEQIIELTDEKIEPSSIVDKTIDKLTKIQSKIFKKYENKSSNEDKIPQEELKNIGSMKAFFITDQSGFPLVTKQDGIDFITVFINKLDAVIHKLQFEEICKPNHEPQVNQIDVNSAQFKLLKLGYENKKVRFVACYGFRQTSTPVGTKWVKVDNNPFTVSSTLLIDCPLSDIENGYYDLDSYFSCIENVDLNIAIEGLIRTNLTPIEDLKILAEKSIADMKLNTVKREPKEKDEIERRLLFTIY